MAKPELDPASRQRVEAFKAAPDQVALQSAEEVFVAAYTLNWDDTGGAQRILLAHPACELATALVLFWHGGAGDLLAECATGEDADDEFYQGAGAAFAFLVEAHEAVVSGRVRPGALSFDPRDDDGCDWTAGSGPDDWEYPVDARLFEPVAGS